MATWVRQLTGTAPSDTNSDVTGTAELDNGTAPGDFDPSSVDSVRIQVTLGITSGSPSNDTHSIPFAVNLTTNGGGSTLASINDTDSQLASGDTADKSCDVTDSSPSLAASVADWEGAELNPAASWTSFSKTAGPDGYTVAVTSVTVTITYTAATPSSTAAGTISVAASASGQRTAFGTAAGTISVAATASGTGPAPDNPVFQNEASGFESSDTTVTVSHTLAAGTNRRIFIGVGVEETSSGGVSVTSVKYDNAGTPITATQVTDGTTSAEAIIAPSNETSVYWYEVLESQVSGLTDGNSYDVQVIVDATVDDVFVRVVQFQNCDQSANVESVFVKTDHPVTGNPPGWSVTSTVDNSVLLEVIQHSAASQDGTVASPAVELAELDGAGSTFMGSYIETTTAGTYTFDWAFTGSASRLPDLVIEVAGAGSVDPTGTAAATISVAATASGTRTTSSTAAATISLAATASGTRTTSTTASAAISVAATATGTGWRDHTGIASASISVAASASGTRTTSSTAAGTVSLAASASGQRTAFGTAAATISLAASASGTGSGTATATASGTISVAATATGQRSTTGTASASISVSGDATGTRTTSSTAAATISVAATASGTGTGAGTGTAAATISLAATASGTRTTSTTASATISVAATASGTGSGTATGTAAATVSLAATATGQRSTSSTAAATISVAATASGTGSGTATGTASASISVSGDATGTRTTSSTAAATVSVSVTADGAREATATGSGTITVTATADGTSTTPGVNWTYVETEQSSSTPESGSSSTTTSSTTTTTESHGVGASSSVVEAWS